MIDPNPPSPARTGTPPGEVVSEEGAPGGHPWVVHPGWSQRFPWLVQGTTVRREGGLPLDFGIGGRAPVQGVLGGWERLRAGTGSPVGVVARQVHGSRVVLHGPGDPGLRIVHPPADGHATASPGVLLAVTVADCVPVFLVDGQGRGIALLHAGWRGVVAGILEEGVATLRLRLGIEVDDLSLHLGPSICGLCYEVGPEVHEALGLPVPAGPTPVDLRAELARRAVAIGISGARITRSSRCTREEGETFFSHRGGDAGRQVAFLGIAPRGGSGR